MPYRDKETEAAYQAAYREANREKIRARVKAWKKANPEAARAQSRRTRKRQRDREALAALAEVKRAAEVKRKELELQIKTQGYAGRLNVHGI